MSPDPQAEPQAEGFSSGLSPDPHAEPQAEGLSPDPQAAGLSPDPHAAGLSPAPQAAAAAVLLSLFQSDKFASAIIMTIPFLWRKFVPRGFAEAQT